MTWANDIPAEGELHPLSRSDLDVMREAYRALQADPSDDTRVTIDENTRTVRVEHAGITVSLYARPVRASDVLLDRAAPGVEPEALIEGYWQVNDLQKCERHLCSLTMKGG